jgi:uncharacterized RDD family membrane protein YckC
VAVAAGRLEVETADHVVLRYDLAGGGNRGFAALVDFIIASFLGFGVLTATALLAAAFGPAVVTTFGGVIALLGLLAIWLYFIVLEWMWNGQTIGKRVFGLRVIGGDGAPAGFVAVLVRNLGRIIDFLPGFYGLGLLVIVLSPRSQRLGDMAAGTYVVRAPQPRLDYFSLRTVTPLGAGTAVTTRRLPGEAQRLVREFVAREASLAPADRARVAKQLADRLRPYAVDADASLDDVEFLRALARALRASASER